MSQISAFYFPTFEKADCTIFALLVGRSVSTLIFVFLYNRLEQKKTKIRIQNKKFVLFTWSSFTSLFTCCLFMSAASFSSKLFVAKSAFLPMIFKYLCFKVCSSSNYFINDQYSLKINESFFFFVGKSTLLLAIMSPFIILNFNILE